MLSNVKYKVGDFFQILYPSQKVRTLPAHTDFHTKIHPCYLSVKLISAFFYRPIWMMPPLPGASRSNGWKCESAFIILHAKKGIERSQRPNVCWYWQTVNQIWAVVLLLKCVQVMIQVARSSNLWSFSI